VEARIGAFAQAEADLILSADALFRFHSGVPGSPLPNSPATDSPLRQSPESPGLTSAQNSPFL
jgi:hypothetical protein